MDDEDDWIERARGHPAKRAVSIRLDEDILDFFKADGKGYQTRMNNVLRAYMEAMERRKTQNDESE